MTHDLHWDQYGTGYIVFCSCGWSKSTAADTPETSIGETMKANRGTVANKVRVHPRWYMGMSEWRGSTGKTQIDNRFRHWKHRDETNIDLPEPVLRMAQAEYDIQFGGQPYERMQERGGLSVLEVISLLADALERERGTGPWAEQPTTLPPPETPVSERPQGQR